MKIQPLIQWQHMNVTRVRVAGFIVLIALLITDADNCESMWRLMVECSRIHSDTNCFY
jgi:hypothetical protein